MKSDEVEKQFLNEGAEVNYTGPMESGPSFENEMSKRARLAKEANQTGRIAARYRDVTKEY